MKRLVILDSGSYVLIGQSIILILNLLIYNCVVEMMKRPMSSFGAILLIFGFVFIVVVYSFFWKNGLLRLAPGLDEYNRFGQAILTIGSLCCCYAIGHHWGKWADSIWITSFVLLLNGSLYASIYYSMRQELDPETEEMESNIILHVERSRTQRLEAAEIERRRRVRESKGS